MATDAPAPINSDGRYYWYGDANGVTGDNISFVGDPALMVAGTMALTWTILQRATDGSYPVLTYNIGAGDVVTNLGAEGTPQETLNESGLISVVLSTATGISISVTSGGGTATVGATEWIVGVAITRNNNETLPFDYPNPFNPTSYNAERFDEGGTISATLAQLRTRIINRLGFTPIAQIDAAATFLQLRTRVTARCGFIVQIGEHTGMTLLAIQTYLMQRLGYSNQAANPPPGMKDFLTSIINESQQMLWRRYAQEGYQDTVPPILVAPTDVLTLDNQAVQILAVATGKAHYGQSDAQIVGNQFENYLSELMARSPPNLPTTLAEVINSSIQIIWRRYAYQDNDTGGVDAGAPPAYLVNDSDVCTVDSQAVEMFSVAALKAHYSQKDAAYVQQQSETYLLELLKRQPPNLTATVNDFLKGAQDYLYRMYTALHTMRLFRWKVIPGQKFYSLMDNDEDVLSGYHMDPNKEIQWAGIQDTRNVWYPLIRGIPPEVYTMIEKEWRPARYDIRQCIELYPAPDQVYWLWIRGNFGLLSFTNDSDQTTLDSNLVFLQALADAKMHYGQKDAGIVGKQAEQYRMQLIAGTHATGRYIPHSKAIPPAVVPVLVTGSGLIS